jgi:hypothetical protein
VLCNYITPDSTCQQLFFLFLNINLHNFCRKIKNTLDFLGSLFYNVSSKHEVLKEKRRKL